MAPTRRNDPCTCGSGRKYKHCCGRLADIVADDDANDIPVNISRFSGDAEFKPSGFLVDRIRTDEQFERMCADQPPGQRIGAVVLPRGIMAKGKFADPGICKTLIEFADRKGGFDSTIQDPAQDGGAQVRSADRVSINVDIRELFDQVVPHVTSAYREAEKFFGVDIEWFEYPELLRYTEGGHYLPHSDAENWDPDRHCWVRGMDRDLSIIIYLNGDFEGGHLDFPNFGFRLKPQSGMLACFPADHRYVHSARPVESGVRYILVSWAAVRGTPRVNKEMPGSGVPMSSVRQ